MGFLRIGQSSTSYSSSAVEQIVRSDVQPLISGVSGALHESFSTEEEAVKVFQRQCDKGNTKIVGGKRSTTVRLQGTPQARAPLSFPMNSPSERFSVQVQPPPDASAPRTGSSEMAAFQHSPRRRSRSTYDATSPARSISPSVVHPNVSYTRGSSSSGLSPGYRRGMAGALVRTPTELDSYPSGDESTSHRAPEANTDNQFDTSSVRDMPITSTPERTSIIAMEIPSDLQSYPSGNEYSTLPPMTGSILSPLSAPGFLTPEDLSPSRLSRRSSVASSTRSQQRAMSRSTSSRNSHFRQKVSLQPLVYLGSASPGDHSRCQHTCPHCKSVSVYTSGGVTPVLLSQPMHAQNVMHDPIHDPRSPMGKNSIIPGYAQFVFCLFRVIGCY